jgi:predicted transcriptional regulator
MAMTVRLPEDIDARLEALAAARHTSKHALLIEAADRFVSTHGKTERVLEAVDEITDRYSNTLKRLEDA